MINKEIKDMYEIDWESENNKQSNPHSVDNTVNDTIQHTQDILKKTCEDFETILDLGCGDGKYHQQFFPQYKFIGLDYIKKDFISNNNNIYHIQDLNSLPYTCLDNQKFNMITCIEVLEHLYRPDLFIEYIYDNLLNDNGYLFLTTDNKNNIDDLFNKTDISIYNPRLKQHTKNRWTHGHIRYFDVSSLYTLFEDVGFSIKLMGGCGTSNSPILDRVVETYKQHFNISRNDSLKALGYAFPQYCPSMYILAQKISKTSIGDQHET